MRKKFNGKVIEGSKVEIIWIGNDLQPPDTYKETFEKAPQSWKAIRVSDYGTTTFEELYPFFSGKTRTQPNVVLMLFRIWNN